MALLDFKIAKIQKNKRHIAVTINVYRGKVTIEDELVDDKLAPVKRYRRIAKVGSRTFEYDVPKDMTRKEFMPKARAFLRNKLLTFAETKSHTVITQQRDISKLEAVTNEKEIIKQEPVVKDALNEKVL